MTSSRRSRSLVTTTHISAPLESGYLPFTGARACYLHSLLHDWADAKGLAIFQNLKVVMKIGYSKLFINENVVPSKGAHTIGTGLDLLVMAVSSAAECTERQWQVL